MVHEMMVTLIALGGARVGAGGAVGRGVATATVAVGRLVAVASGTGVLVGTSGTGVFVGAATVGASGTGVFVGTAVGPIAGLVGTVVGLIAGTSVAMGVLIWPGIGVPTSEAMMSFTATPYGAVGVPL